jgi:serine/threonine-protein kinase
MDAGQSSIDEPVAGDFTLVRELGRGSSSVVHLAWQPTLERYVAVKRLLRTLSSDTAATARLRREGQIIARLDDPGVVRLYDMIADGADVVLVMEYVRGPSLQFLSAARPPSPSQALAVVADVAKALDYAVGQGVVHRDVKPANVLVTTTGQCKLGDFGLARITGELAMFMSNDGTIRGTPLYMAPEQLRGEVPSPAWDVYALALMALELLSGSHPFAGLSVRGVVEAHLDGGAGSAAGASSLPRAIVDVLRRGLSLSGNDRPTAFELADGLLQGAPNSWLGAGPEAVPHLSAASAERRTAGAPLGSDGLWAGADHDGWTADLVHDETWLGTADLTIDQLPVADAAVAAHGCHPVNGAATPPDGHADARMPTIDDRWITHPPVKIPARPVSRLRLSRVAIVAAFIVGFVLALAAIELL